LIKTGVAKLLRTKVTNCFKTACAIPHIKKATPDFSGMAYYEFHRFRTCVAWGMANQPLCLASKAHDGTTTGGAEKRKKSGFDAVIDTIETWYDVAKQCRKYTQWFPTTGDFRQYRKITFWATKRYR
jgi:hypothetical protein